MSKEDWQKKIMAINDRKLLEYIQDQCRIRLDIARADYNMEKPESKKEKSTDPISSYGLPPRKLKPVKMVPQEEEEEQYY